MSITFAFGNTTVDRLVVKDVGNDWTTADFVISHLETTQFFNYKTQALIAEVHNLLGQRTHSVLFSVQLRAEDKIRIWTFESQISKTENKRFN